MNVITKKQIRTFCFCIFFLLIVPFLGYSQSYHPLLESGKYWDQAINTSITPCNINIALRYYYSLADSVMPNGLSYKIPHYYRMDPASGGTVFCPPFFVNTVPYSSWVVLREDTVQQKVYRYTPFDSTEFLVYDFNLVAGDTLFFNSTGTSASDIVDSTAMLSFPDGSTRKTIYMHNGHYYIEGIGSPTAGIGNQLPGLPVNKTYFMCVNHNGIDLYGTICTSVFVSTEELSSTIQPEIYPVPATDILHVKYPGIFNVEIINATGQLVFTNEGRDQVDFNCSNAQPGVYVVAIFNGTNILRRRIIVK